MGNDLISELPDSLITQILLWLPTKDSVKTSLLSTRWRNLWLDVPGLDLNSDDFPLPINKNFTERFLEFNNNSPLQKFKMIHNHRAYSVCGDRFKEWIATAVDSGIQHLDFEIWKPLYINPLYFMPMNIYKSTTLVSLKLVLVKLENPEFVVSLPCLKIMHLKNIWYRNDHGPLIVEKLISGCPVLEHLTVMRILDVDLQALPRLRVRSPTLKNLDLMFHLEQFTRNISVEIDAPKLKNMSFGDWHSNRIMVKNLSSLFKIELDTELGGSPSEPDDLRNRDIIGDFLTGISSVRHMIISPRTLMVIYRYSELGPIPIFHHLSRLKATILSLKQLLAFLESCPNLKNLILDCSVSVEPEQIDLTSVPRCMTSTLECVEINKLIRNEETGIKVVKFFHENSPFLKNLKLRFTDSPMISMTNQTINSIFKKYLTTTKRSPRCQVTISLHASGVSKDMIIGFEHQL